MVLAKVKKTEKSHVCSGPSQVCAMPACVKIGASAYVLNHITKHKQLPHIYTTLYRQQQTTTNQTEKNILILQININIIGNKHRDHEELVHTIQTDIITIQETKTITTSKHIKLHTYLHSYRSIHTQQFQHTMLRIHTKKKIILQFSTYTYCHYATYITNCIQHITNSPYCDVNTYSTLW